MCLRLNSTTMFIYGILRVMLLFGHVGIATGVIKACGILGSVSRPHDIYQTGSDSEIRRIKKGGSWFDMVDEGLRSGFIGYSYPQSAGNLVGFRTVLQVE